MTKATCKRKHLIEGWLTESEGKSMIIMVGGVAVDRQAWNCDSS